MVTGSASGIGLATKKLLESEGRRVIGVDIAAQRPWRSAATVPAADRPL